ncbi:MAG TPA: hypothetical protein VMC07_02025 [Candidatus Omnitrophota bacterium]|nr:hypothetical protein [Candidatus Omnitrophota bacterium]
MGTLDQVMQMRRENHSDEEIISALRSQGVSPREINDALNHAQIKNAVSDIMGDGNEMQAPSPQGMEEQNYNEYPQQEQQYPQEQVYTPQQTQAYPQQGYPGYQGYGQDYYAQPTNTDTIVEISSQVFDEKISDAVKKIDSFDEFKILTQAKIENMNERLKRIEEIIDKLQSAVLEKIGAYGSNIEGIRKEMSMMQDSFSKVVGQKIEKTERKEESEDKSQKKRK